MKLIVAPDSFKGTLTSEEVINIISKVAVEHFKDIEILKVPIADGGEGTVRAIIQALDGQFISCEVQGPLGASLVATYGLIDQIAVIEMAEASGITCVPKDQLNPLLTSTYGTGQLIKDALNHPLKKLVIGIGGSATNDGGLGMAMALGVKFYDAMDQLIDQGCGKNLNAVKRIDPSGLDQRLLGIDVEVICDVTNPLTGPEGATHVYGPQKGASKEMLHQLEEGMVSYGRLLSELIKKEINDVPGSGAAGGLGAGLVTFLKANLKPGVETILDLVSFDTLVKEADLVITGEGRIDGQSVYGKVPVGVSKRCIPYKVPVIAIVGCTGPGYEVVYDHGIDVVISTVTELLPEEDLLANAKINLEKTADRLFRMLTLGKRIT